MDSDRLQALLCVLELGSLSAAAGKLGYSTSGMSRMMAALEQELDLPLLVRTREGIRPTAECSQLLPSIRQLCESADSLQAQAGSLRGLLVGRVRIGTSCTAFYRPLAGLSRAFRQEHPRVEIELQPGCTADLLRQLRQGDLDLCIVSHRPDISDWTPLFHDRMVAWVPADHPLAQEKAVPLTAFTLYPVVGTYPERDDTDNAAVFARSGIHPQYCCGTQDSYATWKLVEAGIGISMENALNSREWSGDVQILPLSPPQSVEIGIAAREKTLAGRAFREWLMKNLRPLTDVVQ